MNYATEFAELVSLVPAVDYKNAHKALTDYVREHFQDVPSFCRNDELTNSFTVEFEFEYMTVIVESVAGDSRVVLTEGTKIISESPRDCKSFAGYFVTALLFAVRNQYFARKLNNGGIVKSDLDYHELFEGSELNAHGYIRLQRAFNSSFVHLLCFPDYNQVADGKELEENDVEFDFPIVDMFILTGDSLLSASKFLQISVDVLDVDSLQNKFLLTTRDQLVPGQTFFIAGEVMHLAIATDDTLHCICSTYDYTEYRVVKSSAPVVAVA